MASQTQHQNSPILRLSSDIWTLIANVLDYGDLHRLIAIGNRPLADRLRLGAESLKVNWVLHDYIYLDRVFETITRFKNLRSFEFREPRHKILCWTPVSWHLLPQQLTSLSLSFVGAPGIFLLPGTPASVCPGLINLDLADDLEERYTLNKGNTLTKIDLNGLPPTLLRLRIRSARGLIIDPSHLQLLPLHLENLVLDFAPSFPKDIPRTAHSRIPLPPLPPCIKDLMFGDSSSDYWHVDCNSLPASLERLAFKVDAYTAYHGDLTNPDGSTFNLEGMTTRFPNLVELELSWVQFSVADAIRLIPSSVTRLSLEFPTSTDHEASLINLHFGHRLTRYNSNCKALDEIIQNGQNALPRLSWLRMLDDEVENVKVIPKNVTKLQLIHHVNAEVPLSVVKFGVFASWKPLRYRFNITPLHKLTYLRLSLLFKKVWLEQLPNTLEKVRLNMDSDVWFELVLLMNQKDRLPNLCYIQLYKMMNFDSLTSTPLPPQLERLTVKLEFAYTSQDLTDSHLSNLRLSHLKTLHLITWHETLDNCADHFEILNNLPSNLKRLKLDTCNMFSTQWPVIMPSSLTDIDVRFTHANRQAIKWDTDDEHDSEVRPSLVLPASLTRLCATQSDAKSLSSSFLPPSLSVLFMNSLGTVGEYFASRVPPASGMQLNTV